MSMTLEQLAAEALSLPSQERALLADRIVESLDLAETEEVRQSWLTEAMRRRDEVRNGQVKTVSSDDALARVRRAVSP